MNYGASLLVNTSLLWSVCADTYLLGGYNVLGPVNRSTYGQYLTRSFSNLPSHNMVYLSFTLWRIDSWDSLDYFDVMVGSKTFRTWNQSFSYWPNVGYCGNAYRDSPNYRVFARAVHASTSLKISFIMRNDESSNNEVAGFRDIRLLFATTSSSIAMNETMCAVSPVTLPGGQCVCTEGKYMSTSGSCLKCHSLCKSCFDSSAADCYQCADGASFNGTICIQCDSSCSVCTGPNANQCVECVTGYVLYNSKTCVNASKISSPLVLVTDVCNRNSAIGLCDSGLFLYWDNSCLDSCISPLITINTSLPYMQCSFPCTTSNYLYWNGSCISTCSAPFVISVIKSHNLCVDPCSSSQYMSWNGSCLDSCTYPKNTRVESNQNFCDLPCQTSEYYYNNATCIASCPSPMTVAIINGVQICKNPCKEPTQYLYWDSSCTDSCLLPLQNATLSLPYLKCSYQCLTSEYLYWNGTCAFSCDPPLVTSIVKLRNLCVYPCSSGEYLNWDGSCLSSCIYPKSIRVEAGEKYCDLQCPISQYLYENISCISSCPTPMLVTTVDSAQICRKPCYDPTPFLYWDDSCAELCNFPLTNLSSPLLYSRCSYSCSSSEYLYWNGTCTSSCNPPLVTKIIKFRSLCVYPCSSAQYLNWDGSCLASCIYPKNIRVEVDKKYCDLQCPISQYLYENISCITLCPSPMKVITVDSAQICRKPCYDPTPFLYWDDSCAESCDSPLTNLGSPLLYSRCSYSCSPDQYLYWNSTCASTCSFPLVTKIVKSRNLCTYPCLSGQYLNWNGLCLSSCVYPKKMRVESGKNYCDLPCLISEFFYENGTCFSSCSSPMKIVTIDSAQICRKPCLDPTPYYCPDDQNCMPVCTSPSKAFDRGFYTSCELQISAEDKKAVQGLASMSNNAGNASSVTTMATSVLSASDPGGVSAGMLTKILQYTKFLTVEHNARLEMMLKSSKLTTGFLFFAPKMHASTKEKFKNELLPAEFIKYKVHSSFIVNFWDGFMSLAICVGILFFIFLLEIGTRSKDTESYLNFFVQKVRYGVQNFLLMQFYNCYGDIVFFTVLNLTTVDFGTPSAALSFNMAFVFTFAGIVVLLLHIMLLLKYQRIKRQPNSNEPHEENVDKFSKSYEGVQILFFSFKDASLVTQGFFLFLTVRNVLYSLIVTLMYKHTFVQLILMMTLSLAMVVYLIFARPFKRLVNLFQQLFGEIVLLVVNGSLLGIFIITTRAQHLINLQENLNEVIIVSNMIVGFIAPTFLIIKITIIMIELHQSRRDWAQRQNRVMETLEEQVRKRQLKKTEPVEQPNDKNLLLGGNILAKVKPPRDLLSASTQLSVKLNMENNMLDIESTSLTHPQKSIFHKESIPHSAIPASLNLLIAQPSIPEIKDLTKVQDGYVYYDNQQDFDASSTKLKPDVSDVQENSFEVRKTRWLNQRQRMNKVKKDI